MLEGLGQATLETAIMTAVPLLASYVLGIPIAFLCLETGKGGLFPNVPIHAAIQAFIAVGRAIPFVMFMVLMLPFTRWLIGTGTGTWAVTVPMTICATPFVSRMIETSLKEAEVETIEAAKVDGAGNLRLMAQIEFAQVLPEIVDGMGVTSIAILGYTTMAGTLGGGGLGSYAIAKGIQRYDWVAALAATAIIVAMAFVAQTSFRFASERIKK